MKLLARDANSPLPLLIVLALLVVTVSTIIDASNDLFFALTIAAVAFGVYWTLPQAFKPREPREPQARQ